MSTRGVGGRVRRNEDGRHLGGQSTFVADVRLPHMRDVAFVRSMVPHGQIMSIRLPDGLPPGTVWTAADLEGLAQPIIAAAASADFRVSEQPILATDKVRFFGEPIAMVIADDRATAEDIAELIEVDIEALPPILDPLNAADTGLGLVHDHWPDNRYMVRVGDFGDVDRAARDAEVTITRDYKMNRHAGVPLETRGCVAYMDQRADQLVMYSSTQFPHVIRSVLAGLLGIEERRFRVIAPDVGGGFGIKNNINSEEVAVCAAARQLGCPLRWIEDRWEHFVGSAHARDHRYRITAHATSEGEILGLEAEILVDAGAYSVWPWTAVMEAGMAAGMIPGPYRIRNYRYTATTAATNKAPLGPYRGVARPGACFAIERTIDEVARAVQREPAEVRIANMVPAEDLPYESITSMVYDSGDYAESVRRAQKAIHHDEVRQRQLAQPIDSIRRLGLGYASYTEQTAHGAEEWSKRGLPIIFGYETARATIEPDGSLVLDVGIQSHGQGLETSLAQVAHDVLGVDPASVTVRHGDSGISPFGMGTFASRSMVMAGGATHLACERLSAKLSSIAAHLLDCDPSEIAVDGTRRQGPSAAISLRDIADAAYLHIDRLPVEIEAGLSETAHYRPEISTGAFAYSTHAAVVEVDTETGMVDIIEYAVVEDCGRIVNPMIVDGQIHGGLAQGIGTALYEQLRYDENGIPQDSSFLDYRVPGSTAVPSPAIVHTETPSPHTVLGLKGMGEGPAIAPPAALANAITDALDISMTTTPMTPEVVWNAIHQPVGP